MWRLFLTTKSQFCLKSAILHPRFSKKYNIKNKIKEYFSLCFYDSQLDEANREYVGKVRKMTTRKKRIHFKESKNKAVFV